MKKLIYLILVISLFSCDALQELSEYEMPGLEETGLTEDEVIRGLKEALEMGIEHATTSLGTTDGFNLNPEIRIPFMKDAEEVEKKLRQMGLSGQVDRFEVQLNRAAEAASAKAFPIFKDAILNMSFSDAWGILNNENPHAATDYLKKTTSDDLEAAFRPEIKKAIDQVELTKYWNPLAQTYNNLPFINQPATADLEQYVLDQSLKGLFSTLAKEEEDIRKNPEARITELLEKVFGN